MNVIETPKKAHDASINSNEIDQLEFFSDNVFEKATIFQRVSPKILKF